MSYKHCWINNFPLAKALQQLWIVELQISLISNMHQSPLNYWIANFPLAKAWNFSYMISNRCWFVELVIFHLQKLEKFQVRVPKDVDLLNCNLFHWQKLCNKCGLAKILTCTNLHWIVELQIFHLQKLEIFYIWVQNGVDLLNW